MKKILAIILGLINLLNYTVLADITEKEIIPPVQSEPVDAHIVAPVNNKLEYTPYSDKGDILGDFSYSGFYNGEYELPITENLPVAMEISPTGTGDDTLMIQNAIDTVSSSEDEALMKVLKLKAGKYYINSNGIKMKSGVILSGEGQGPAGTILYAFEPVQYTVLNIMGGMPEEIGPKAYITDKYINAGSNKINVSDEDVKKFSVGDEIVINHTSTDRWADAIDMLGMVDIYGGDSSWGDGEIDMITERIITGINGTEITLDFGVFVPYMTDLVPTYISKLDDSKRIKNVGVENLRLESYYNGTSTDEEHAKDAVVITRGKNIFVRNVTTKYFSNYSVSCQYRSKQVTIENCSSLEPVSESAAAKRYSFVAARCQQLLFTGCYAYEGVISYGVSYPSTGPISFVDNVNDRGTSTNETHGTWSTGVLFDNLYNIENDTKATISMANNGKYGTASTASQGWTAASSVVWNCLASAIVIHDLPLNYQNFGVGIWGHYTDDDAKKSKNARIEKSIIKYMTSKGSEYPEGAMDTDDNTPFVGNAYFEAKYTPVNPRSLYKAQLSERITGVISNARANAPIMVSPKPDKKTNDGEIKISGLCELGATKVLVYIDDLPYEADINNDNTFNLNKTLEEGIHKIYATQVINGVEGDKNADRFIIIGEENGNHEYLKSVYPPEKTSALVNDTRLTFDSIINKDTLPESIMPVSVFGGLAEENNPVTVINQFGEEQKITGNYRAVAGRAESAKGFDIKEYGISISLTYNDFKVNAPSQIKLSENGAYGILFYNLKPDVKYFIRPYVIYSLKDGTEYTLTGQTEEFTTQQ